MSKKSGTLPFLSWHDGHKIMIPFIILLQLANLATIIPHLSQYNIFIIFPIGLIFKSYFTSGNKIVNQKKIIKIND